MQIYCSRYKKFTDNPCPKKLVIITNKKIKGKSRCADCMAIRSFSDKKNGIEAVLFQFFID